MVWIFIPQNDQHISGFNLEYLPGLLGEDNLTAVAHTNRSEYVLAFGRYAFAGLLLVVMDEVVQFHVVQFCQRVTVQNVGHGLTGLPLCDSLPGNTNLLCHLFLRKLIELSQGGQIVSDIILYFHTFHTSCPLLYA